MNDTIIISENPAVAMVRCKNGELLSVLRCNEGEKKGTCSSCVLFSKRYFVDYCPHYKDGDLFCIERRTIRCLPFKSVKGLLFLNETKTHH